MISTRVLVAAYAILLLSVGTFWFGLHALPKWVLYVVFAAGMAGAGITVAHPWLRKAASAKPRDEL
jgi:hypothetical protein